VALKRASLLSAACLFASVDSKLIVVKDTPSLSPHKKEDSLFQGSFDQHIMINSSIRIADVF
jgi:hypothetical protein